MSSFLIKKLAAHPIANELLVKYLHSKVCSSQTLRHYFNNYNLIHQSDF